MKPLFSTAQEMLVESNGTRLGVCSVLQLPGNHRIIEWLEGIFKDHLVQAPCHGQGYLPLDQVAQSLIQPHLEHFQGEGIHNFSGQPGPVSHHPRRNEFLPYI